MTYAGLANTQFCLLPCFLAPPGGRPQVVSGSEDGSIYLWDAADAVAVTRIAGRPKAEGPAADGGHCDAVLTVDAHPGGALLASGAHSGDSSIKIWQRCD